MKYQSAPTWFQETYSDLFSGDTPVEDGVKKRSSLNLCVQLPRSTNMDSFR